MAAQHLSLAVDNSQPGIPARFWWSLSAEEVREIFLGLAGFGREDYLDYLRKPWEEVPERAKKSLERVTGSGVMSPDLVWLTMGRRGKRMAVQIAAFCYQFSKEEVEYYPTLPWRLIPEHRRDQLVLVMEQQFTLPF